MTDSTQDEAEFENPLFGKHIGEFGPIMPDLMERLPKFQISPQLQFAIGQMSPQINTGLTAKIQEMMAPRLQMSIFNDLFTSPAIMPDLFRLSDAVQSPAIASLAGANTLEMLGPRFMESLNMPAVNYANLVQIDPALSQSFTRLQESILGTLTVAPQMDWASRLDDLVDTSLLPSDDTIRTIADWLESEDVDEVDFAEFEEEFAGDSALVDTIEEMVPAVANRLGLEQSKARAAVSFATLNLLLAAASAVCIIWDNDAATAASIFLAAYAEKVANLLSRLGDSSE